MKKIGLVFKEASENKIKKTLKDSSSCFVVRYCGISSPDLSTLRKNLKGCGASLFVVKNSVARRALKESGLEVLVKSIEGPCGLIFSKDEPVGASRILCDFSKDHEHLKLEGGSMKEKILEKKDIEAIAKLPTKEVLRAQVVGTLKSPITGFVMTLNQLLSGFVNCLEQIKNKKEDTK